MNIEKRKNGYRARRTIDGVTYRVTFDHKPTQREAEEAINALAKDNKTKCELTLRKAIEEYKANNKNVFSASTIANLKYAESWFSDDILNKRVDKITITDIQREVNTMAGKYAPKTVINRHGVLSNVIKSFVPEANTTVNLPKKIAKEIEIPTDEEVQKLYDLSIGTRYQCAVYLAFFLGLRRSEICAITKDDLEKIDDGYVLTINKACVTDENNNDVIKTTKSPAGVRTLNIPDDLAEMIIKNGKALTTKPKSFSNWVTSAVKKIDSNHFTLHSLRHYVASTLADEGLSRKQIIMITGHKSENMLNKVYEHAKRIDETKILAKNIMEKTVNAKKSAPNLPQTFESVDKSMLLSK